MVTILLVTLGVSVVLNAIFVIVLRRSFSKSEALIETCNTVIISRNLLAQNFNELKKQHTEISQEVIRLLEKDVRDF